PAYGCDGALNARRATSRRAASAESGRGTDGLAGHLPAPVQDEGETDARGGPRRHHADRRPDRRREDRDPESAAARSPADGRVDRIRVRVRAREDVADRLAGERQAAVRPHAREAENARGDREDEE